MAPPPHPPTTQVPTQAKTKPARPRTLGPPTPTHPPPTHQGLAIQPKPALPRTLGPPAPNPPPHPPTRPGEIQEGPAWDLAPHYPAHPPKPSSILNQAGPAQVQRINPMYIFVVTSPVGTQNYDYIKKNQQLVCNVFLCVAWFVMCLFSVCIDFRFWFVMVCGGL